MQNAFYESGCHGTEQVTDGSRKIALLLRLNKLENELKTLRQPCLAARFWRWIKNRA